MDIAACRMNQLVVRGYSVEKALAKTAKRFAITEEDLLKVYNLHFAN